MIYEKPRVVSLSIQDLLSALGPVRATGYEKDHGCPWWQVLSGQCRN